MNTTILMPTCAACGRAYRTPHEARACERTHGLTPPEPRRLGGHELAPVEQHASPAWAVPWGAERGGAP
jgi:hypothetical protein